MNIYLDLLLTFMLIGLFSFGGGMGMMTLIEQKVVFEHQWMSSEELYRFIGIAESTPGPIAVNVATFIGSEKGDLLGALCATFGVVFPSFVIIIIISCFFKKFSDNIIIKTILNGIKPVILGLLFAMCFKVILTNLFGAYLANAEVHFIWQAAVIMGLLFLLYFGFLKFKKKKLQPVLIIIVGALLGIGFGYLNKIM